MKTGHSRIQITPCSEQWDAMHATATGRFCDLCSKNVVDFSSQSDEAVKAYLSERKDEAICGRFYRRQVDRIRIEIDRNLLQAAIPFWQKFLVVVLVCFGQQCFGIDFCFAQTADSLSAPVVQVDSLVPAAQDTLSVDSLALDTLSPLLIPKEPMPRKPEIEWLTCEPGIIMGAIAIAPKDIIEERVEILFPGPDTVKTPPEGLPGIDHPLAKTSHRQEREETPDHRQLVAVLPPVGRRKRKRNKQKQN